MHCKPWSGFLAHPVFTCNLCFSHQKVPKILERNVQKEKKLREGLGKKVLFCINLFTTFTSDCCQLYPRFFLLLIIFYLLNRHYNYELVISSAVC